MYYFFYMKEKVGYELDGSFLVIGSIDILDFDWYG